MSLSPPIGSLCFLCGYDLRGLTRSICPECGNCFDLENPFTYIHPACGRLTKRFRRALASPPLFDCITVALAAILVLSWSSSPGWPYILVDWPGLERLGSPFWVPMVFILGLLAAIGFFRHFAALRRMRRFNPSYQDASKRWRIMAVSSLIIISATLYPWPFWIRFIASWPALKRVAEQDQIRRDPSWIGLFHVKEVRIYPQGFVFFVTDRTWSREYGICYTPNDNKPPGNQYWYSRPLAHRWWLTSN